jgi:large-conductance mechanosensitive channel
VTFFDFLMLTPVVNSAEELATVGSQAAQANAINWNTIILAAIGFMSTAVTTFASIYIVKLNTLTRLVKDTADQTLVEAKTTSAAALETKEAAQSTVVEVKGVHRAVNSDRDRLMSKIEAQTGTIKEQTALIATMLEQLRVKGVPEARASLLQAQGAPQGETG